MLNNGVKYGVNMKFTYALIEADRLWMEKNLCYSRIVHPLNTRQLLLRKDSFS